jgi:hypothetical protein
MQEASDAAGRHTCSHGLGHGVLGAVGLDARLALRHCDQLSTRAFAASCRSGVFMEAISAAIGGPETDPDHTTHHHEAHAAESRGRLALYAANPYAPCDSFEGLYGAACWLFQGFLILRSTRFDASAAFRVCDGTRGRVGDCYEPGSPAHRSLAAWGSMDH